jgi:hypothetical protein
VNLPPDTPVSIEDQGDGWFPLAGGSALYGNVVARIVSDPGSEPFYLIRLGSPLEVQEPAPDTPSQLRLHTYTHLVVRSRWAGVALGSEPRVSVHLFLVPQGQPLPSTTEECFSLSCAVWARCSVIPAYA